MERVAQRAGAQSSGMSPLYQVLAEDIVAMGVEAVFGLISDDTALLATALDTSGARFYGARHENCAIAMADGYAYVGRGGDRAGTRARQRPAWRDLCESYGFPSTPHLRRGGDGKPTQRVGSRL